jgi:hypothetical protein
MVDYIRPVYQVEERIKALREEHAARGEVLPLQAVWALRQEESKPILEKFKAWVDDLLPGTPPNSALGKALGYTARQWPKLVRHLDHAEMPIDNNYIERQIKSYATGRRAWLFAYDAAGAQASANLYSLVMTCLCRIRHRHVHAERRTMPSEVSQGLFPKGLPFLHAA